MRTFQETMADVLAFTPQAFAALGAHLKPEWLIEALAAGVGSQEQVETRRRKLPAERVLWMVIGMGLFRDRSIQEVVEHLGVSLSQPDPRAGIAPSAIPQAARGLGSTLFSICSN